MRELHRLLVGLVLLSTVAGARELEGVQMPDTAVVEGKSLKLNGVGLRKKLFFNVYVAGLYVETPSKDPATLVSSDQVKQVKMVMLRDLSKEKMSEAIREGFEKNAGPQMPTLRQRLNRLIRSVPDIKKGDVLAVTYVPGKGTTFAGSGEQSIIEGKDFGDALFSVWLGKYPVDSDLKTGLVGT